LGLVGIGGLGVVLISDEFQQASVWVAEVDALPEASGAVTGDGSQLDLDVRLLEVFDRPIDRARPDEADVGVARCDRDASDGRGIEARTVDVELLYSEAIRPASARPLDKLGTEDVSVEGV
jgi:hypothetical protein